jgi:cobalt-zinc-cadmium efflux system membrane fusion protein
MNYKLLLLLIGLFAACAENGDQPVTESLPDTTEDAGLIVLSEEQRALATIETGTPERRMLAEPLRVSGRVEVPPQNLVSVHTPIKGFVRHADLLPGDVVKKGQLLTRIEHRDLIAMQRDYHEARADVAFLVQEAARKDTLAKAEASAERLAQRAATDLAVRQAHLASAAAELRTIGLDPDRLDPANPVTQLGIYAPVSGVISRVMVNIGKLVQPEDLLFEIVDRRHSHVEMAVYAHDLGKLAVGQELRIHAPGRTEPLPGEVHLLGPVIDPATKTARVHGHFAVEPAPVAPGTMVEVEVLTTPREALVVPETAVVRQGDAAYVFLREGAGFRLRQVAIGRITGGYVELLDSTLTPTTELAVTGAYYLMGSAGEEE